MYLVSVLARDEEFVAAVTTRTNLTRPASSVFRRSLLFRNKASAVPPPISKNHQVRVLISSSYYYFLFVLLCCYSLYNKRYIIRCCV